MAETQAGNWDNMDAFFKERGFGLRIGFGKRPALIVVDMLVAFTDPSMPLGADQGQNIRENARLLKAAREVKMPIFFTSVEYDEIDFRDAGIWALKQSGVRTLRAGTPEVQIDPRLERLPDEPIVVKKYASSFFGTDLATRLTARGVDTVIITGCTTSGCVRATAVDALQYGFRPMVVREAVADRALSAHQQSLFDLDAKYADVVGIEETLEYVQRYRDLGF